MSRIYMTVGAGSERLPADIAFAIIPSLPRAQLEQLVQRLVDRLDEEDGDPDLEDATDVEDDFSLSEQAIHYDVGPGCNIADTDYSVDDQPCDDEFQDCEQVDRAVPVFGVDQTAEPIGWKVV